MEQVENQPRFSISSFGARAPCSAPGQPPPPVGTRHPCAPTTQPGADPDEGPSLVGRFCTRRRIGRLDATSRPLHPLLLMSTAFGGSRSLAPKPPEKGVFPLDHFNECKQVRERERVRGPGFARECAGRPSPTRCFPRLPRWVRPFSPRPFSPCSRPSLSLSPPLQVKDDYMACLASHAADAAPCAGIAKAYLACRMDR